MANSAKGYWTFPRVLVAIAVIFGTFGLIFTYTNRSFRRGMDPLMCWKNLHEFSIVMTLYAGDNGLDEREVYQRAGFLVGSTNFNLKCGFFHGEEKKKRKPQNFKGTGKNECNNWRYSRDGLFATCPASPRHEILSYEGWPTTNVVMTRNLPVLWEKGPYHDGKRHILQYDGTGFLHPILVTEAEFHALTNLVSAK
jgi:hypothetical protein